MKHVTDSLFLKFPRFVITQVYTIEFVMYKKKNRISLNKKMICVASDVLVEVLTHHFRRFGPLLPKNEESRKGYVATNYKLKVSMCCFLLEHFNCGVFLMFLFQSFVKCPVPIDSSN
jgi:hypothetical protein